VAVRGVRIPLTASGYLHLLQALTDPADPRHGAAVERLGEDYDPARYDRD
jgi:hypothetical protein